MRFAHTAVLLLLSTVALGCGAQDAGVPAGGQGGDGGAWTVGVGSGAGGGGGSDEGATAYWPPASLDVWQAVDTDWCGDGWIGLDEHTCAYLPASNPTPDALLVFLHGMMPPDASPQGQQQVVAAAAETLGVAALFPRGQPGLCAWAPSVRDWYCWPTNRENVDLHAAGFAAEWEAAAEVMRLWLDVPIAEQYVLGFSNGGYFASYVGLEGWWPLAGFGLVAAGRSYIDAALLGEASPPGYIAVGALDGQSVQNSAQNLAFFMSQQGWPNQFVLHPQRGHEIWPDDIEAAGALWGLSLSN